VLRSDDELLRANTNDVFINYGSKRLRIAATANVSRTAAMASQMQELAALLPGGTFITFTVSSQASDASSVLYGRFPA
jgi:hypothetical protein